MEPYALTQADIAAVEAIKRERYDRWEWNYGVSPPCDLLRRRRVEGCGPGWRARTPGPLFSQHCIPIGDRPARRDNVRHSNTAPPQDRSRCCRRDPGRPPGPTGTCHSCP